MLMIESICLEIDEIRNETKEEKKKGETNRDKNEINIKTILLFSKVSCNTFK